MLTREMIVKPVTMQFRPWVILLFVCCPPMWGLIFLLAYGVPWDSPNTPAWVQAVGSVAAILVAVWIANAKDRRDEKIANEKVRAFRELLLYLADDSQRQAVDLKTVLEVKGAAAEWSYICATHARQIELLMGVDATAIPWGDVAVTFLKLRAQVHSAHQYLRLLEVNNSPGVVLTLQGVIPRIESAAALLALELARR
jgi:hypothetical protein